MFNTTNLQILKKYGKEDLAILYIGKYKNQILEFVESIQPQISREQKWVIIISTLFGCPMRCKMCDAGEYYHGLISKEGMLAQILYIIDQRFPNRIIQIPKLKIQFARMGEPSLNPAVLEVLRSLPNIIKAPGLLPCMSTVAPNGTDAFFSALKDIKSKNFTNGMFQLQFSIHSSNEEIRQEYIAPNIWSLEKIAEFGKSWFENGDRKITLNFIVGDKNPIDPQRISKIFSSNRYLIKLTPVNPTYKAQKNCLNSLITKNNFKDFSLVREFESLGFETILSIGDWEENLIGSNCGQFATKYYDGEIKLKENYVCHQYSL